SGNVTVNNTFFTDDTPGITPFGIIVKNDSSGLLDATITDNTTAGAQLLLLNHDDVGSGGAANGTTRVVVQGNTINVGSENIGIDVISSDNGADSDLDLSLTLLNNNITVVDESNFTFIGGIRISVQNTSRANLRIEGNTSNSAPSALGAEGLILQTFDTAQVGIHNLSGPADTFLNGLNTFTGAWSLANGGTANFVVGSPVAPVATTHPNPLLLAATPIVPEAPLVPPENTSDNHVLSQAELDAIVAAAIARWTATGLTAAQQLALQQATVLVDTLSPMLLGIGIGSVIRIDDNAGGVGWFIDDTPADNAEFDAVSASRLVNGPQGVDLLTTVMHELGHILGLEDTYADVDRDNLMYGYAGIGERRLPNSNQALGAIPGSIEHDEFMLGPVNIGTLPANKAVSIIFQATVNNLSNGIAPLLSAQGQLSGSNISTVMTDDPAGGGMADATTTTLDSLTLGDQVWIEVGGSAMAYDAGTDTPVNGVTVRLYVDDGDGVLDAGDGAAISSTTTATIGAPGRYQFINLLPGNYIVQVVNSSGPLAGTFPLPGAVDPDNNVDNDNNGAAVTGFETASQAITLAYNTEPTAGTGNDTNNTLDFGFLANAAPVATNNAYTTDQDTAVMGNVITDDTGSGVDSDAEMNSFTVATVNGSSMNVGSQITLASGALLTVNSNGAFTYDPNGAFDSLAAMVSDVDSFTYQVSDGQFSNSATVFITVNGLNDPPVATNNAYTTDENTAFTTGNVITDDTGDGVDSDPEMGMFSVTAVNGVMASVGMQITLASGALLTVNANGTFSYDPNGQFESLDTGDTAMDSFTYTITDPTSLTSTATVNITINGVDDPPVATDNDYSVNENATLMGNIITDDTGDGADGDAEMESFTVVIVNGYMLNSGVPFLLPSGAQLTVNSNGTFTYDPSGAFDSLSAMSMDTDSFTYQVSDGQLSNTTTVTITINGVNNAPVATDDTNTTDEDTAVMGNVLTDGTPDSDVDDIVASLTVTQVQGSAANVGMQVTLASGARVTVNSDGTYTYNPNDKFESLGVGDTAMDSFTYRISDPGMATSNLATVTIAINGVNDAPDAKVDNFSVFEDATVMGNLITNNNGNGADSDPENDPLTVTFVNGMMGNLGTQIMLASGALLQVNANGTFTYDPNGAFDSLETGQVGFDSFNYTIQDPGGLPDTAGVLITINGGSPFFRVEGTTAFLTGTNGDDSIVVHNPSRTVQFNGLSFALPMGVTTLSIDGAQGRDTLNIIGTPGDDVAVARPGQVVFMHDGSQVGVEVSAISVEVVILDGNGGTNTATLNDSALDDKFFARPNSGFMTDVSNTYQTNAFGFQLTAVATTGNDLVKFYGSQFADTLNARPGIATIVGPGFSHVAQNFDVLVARSNGGADTGVLFGTSGNDTLTARAGVALMSGTGFNFQLDSFRTVTAKALGGNDLVRFYGGAGDDSLFANANTFSAKFLTEVYEINTVSIERVIAFAFGGNANETIFTDSAGDDNFIGAPNMAELSGLGYFIRATAFDSVVIRGVNGGINRRTLNNINYSLSEQGTWV
ncbi:MAG: tandem-95 repeat protein, partial [Planctomycetaceae bacterium]|nr:tandem-95 repeat protein [Planctomycetaceae bacterium]